MYLGGNNHESWGDWNLSIVRFTYANPDSDPESMKLNLLAYDSTGSCSNTGTGLGYADGATAPYISHMHYEYLNGKHWLFGGTITNNWATNKAGFKTLVFLVELDSSTGNVTPYTSD